MFQYRRKVQLYETDLMGIVHHGNYLRFYEEARVEWAHSNGLLDFQRPESASQLAVVETQVFHKKPARFGDVVVIELQCQLVGIKLFFEYKMKKDETGILISEARTVHVPLNKNLELIRPAKELIKKMENEKWIETWLLSL